MPLCGFLPTQREGRIYSSPSNGSRVVHRLTPEERLSILLERPLYRYSLASMMRRFGSRFDLGVKRTPRKLEKILGDRESDYRVKGYNRPIRELSTRH